jgi:hypothetical protein
MIRLPIDHHRYHTRRRRINLIDGLFRREVFPATPGSRQSTMGATSDNADRPRRRDTLR